MNCLAHYADLTSTVWAEWQFWAEWQSTQVWQWHDFPKPMTTPCQSIATDEIAPFCLIMTTSNCNFRVCRDGWRLHLSSNVKWFWNNPAFTRVNILNSLLYIYNTSRFHVALRLFSNRSQTTSCDKNISDPLGYASYATFFCSYHILTSFVVYYWTDNGNMESICLKHDF